ncbi:MAG: M23 family metallopeptidase [Alistipes sp.]|nr:M23 family metallopeptidase [Alistipes sp.]
MPEKKRLRKLRRRRQRRQRIILVIMRFFVWTGVAVIYYVGFSLFFDTPVEYTLKHSTDGLRSEYATLLQRYDSLSMVLDNLSERDRNVFRILFESNPYESESENKSDKPTGYAELVGRTTPQLKHDLRLRIDELDGRLRELNATYHDLQALVERTGAGSHNIPAIQPVINNQLTRLTASYGMRFHPFYKTLQAHQGVDYTVPEGTHVFATADGRVREVLERNSTAGRTVVIDHGNGYETSYSHLSQAEVRKGQQVRRGDIIARTGDTGLSLAPHLHYEVRYDGMRVDPIHYFFMELTPRKYQRLMRIAQSGMQSFD